MYKLRKKEDKYQILYKESPVVSYTNKKLAEKTYNGLKKNTSGFETWGIPNFFRSVG